jgi:hypothetical protein
MNNAELWNLPDWRVPEQYPTIESYKGDPDPKKADQGSLGASSFTPHLKISHGVWRWEFLRRLDEYRSCWKSKHEEKLSEEDEETALEQFGLVELYDPCLTSFGCQSQKGELEGTNGDTQVQQGNGVDRLTYRELQKSKQSEHLVKFIEENSFAEPEWTDLHEELIAFPFTKSAKELQLKAVVSSSLIAVIDPLRALNSQFTQIKSEINQLKSDLDIGANINDRSEKYTFYLRLLDFKDSGLENRCLADVAKEQGWPKSMHSDGEISHQHINELISTAKINQIKITANV